MLQQPRTQLLVALGSMSLLLAFAAFTLVSAANLNYATLQGINGPISAGELSALQLSTSLTATAVGIFVGVTMMGLAAVIFGRRSTVELSRVNQGPHASA